MLLSNAIITSYNTLQSCLLYSNRLDLGDLYNRGPWFIFNKLFHLIFPFYDIFPSIWKVMRKYIFIKEVGDTNPDRVINNIFDFVTEVYDYASSNERYKPYQANIVLFIKTKAGIEVVPIMHSYLFNDRIEEQLRFMVKYIMC